MPACRPEQEAERSGSSRSPSATMSFSRRSTPRCAGGRSERQSGLSSRPGKSLSATRTSSRTEAAPAADEEDRDVAPELPHARLQLEPARAWQLKVEHEGPS